MRSPSPQIVVVASVCGSVALAPGHSRHTPIVMDNDGGSVTEPNGHPAEAGSTHDASKRPIWTCTLNRVSCAVWRHDQKDAPRYTVAIFREYFSKKEKAVKRNYYFDLEDLSEVEVMTRLARDKIKDFESGAAEPD